MTPKTTPDKPLKRRKSFDDSQANRSRVSSTLDIAALFIEEHGLDKALRIAYTKDTGSTLTQALLEKYKKESVENLHRVLDSAITAKDARFIDFFLNNILLELNHPDGHSPQLRQAVITQDLATVNALLAHGALIKADVSIINTLFNEVTEIYWDLAQTILKACDESLINDNQKWQEALGKLLCRAVNARQHETIEKLLSLNADITMTSYERPSAQHLNALEIALSIGDVDAIQLLSAHYSFAESPFQEGQIIKSMKNPPEQVRFYSFRIDNQSNSQLKLTVLSSTRSLTGKKTTINISDIPEGTTTTTLVSYFNVGDVLKGVDDRRGEPYLASIVAIDGNKIQVHFDGWDTKWDEWLDLSIESNRQKIKDVTTFPFSLSHLDKLIGRTLAFIKDASSFRPVSVIDSQKNKIKVHFIGWDKKYDEWIDVSSESDLSRVHTFHPESISAPIGKPDVLSHFEVITESSTHPDAILKLFELGFLKPQHYLGAIKVAIQADHPGLFNALMSKVLKESLTSDRQYQQLIQLAADCKRVDMFTRLLKTDRSIGDITVTLNKKELIQAYVKHGQLDDWALANLFFSIIEKLTPDNVAEHLETLNTIINTNPKAVIGAVNKKGLSGLHIAAEKRLPELIKILLEKGFKTNIKINKQKKTTVVGKASKKGDWDIVRLFVDYPESESHDSEYARAVVYAIYNSEYELAEALLTKGNAAVSGCSLKNHFAIHLAVKKDQQQLVDALIKRDPNVLAKRTRNDAEKTAIDIALEDENWEILAFLATKPYIQNARFELALLNAYKLGKTELFETLLGNKVPLLQETITLNYEFLQLMLEKNDTALIRQFIDQHPRSFLSQTKDNRSGLRLLAERGQWQLISQLADKLDKPNTETNTLHQQVLVLAYRENQLDVFDKLLDGTFLDFSNDTLITVFKLAVKRHDTARLEEIATKLIKYGYRGDSERNEFRISLMKMAKSGDWQVIYELLQRINRENAYDGVLHESASELLYRSIDSENYPLITELARMIQWKSWSQLIRFTDEANGDYAIHKAIRNNDARTVGILLQHGSHRLLENSANQNSQQLAELLGFEDCLDALRFPQRYASPLDNILSCLGVNQGIHQSLRHLRQDEINEPRFEFNSTALHQAVIKGRYDIALTLIAHGADIHAKDAYGNTALHLAVKHNLVEMTAMLMICGADKTIENNQKQTAVDLIKTPGLYQARLNLAITKPTKVTTPYTIAIYSQNIEMLRFLVERDDSDNGRLDAIKLAIETGQSADIILALIKNDSDRAHAFQIAREHNNDTLAHQIDSNKMLLLELDKQFLAFIEQGQMKRGLSYEYATTTEIKDAFIETVINHIAGDEREGSLLAWLSEVSETAKYRSTGFISESYWTLTTRQMILLEKSIECESDPLLKLKRLDTLYWHGKMSHSYIRFSSNGPVKAAFFAKAKAIVESVTEPQLKASLYHYLAYDAKTTENENTGTGKKFKALAEALDKQISAPQMSTSPIDLTGSNVTHQDETQETLSTPASLKAPVVLRRPQVVKKKKQVHKAAPSGAELTQFFSLLPRVPSTSPKVVAHQSARKVLQTVV